MSFFEYIKNLNRKRKRFRNKSKKSSLIQSTIDSVKSNCIVQIDTSLYNTNNYLSELCELYGSDKGFVNIEKKTPYDWDPHAYSIIYNNLFSHCRENIKLVFECGIGTNNLNFESNMTLNGKPGASLKVWKDYFVNAQIFGADIDRNILFKEDRIETYHVNQLDQESIIKMWNNIKKKDFDLIIDDGLHNYKAALTLFLNSYEKLKKGGIYIIEDVDFEYLDQLKKALEIYNPEVLIINDNYSKNKLITNNNLIIIRKH